jgi:tetratricopeptide (TPR) repeat protein
MPSTVGRSNDPIEITPENTELYKDQSTGVIESEGYDAITAKKTANAKPETFPRSEVVRVIYTTEPEMLLSGFDEMAGGQFLAAVNDFKQVLQDPREVYRHQANFQIGRCYILGGRAPECIRHYGEWPAVNSVYTPVVYGILADLLTGQRKYNEARAQYAKIASLPGITDVGKFNARLGAVKVDIAERKYDEAERAAASIARETANKAEVADAHVLALALQTEAIWRGGKVERLAEATTILERGATIEGAEPGTRAFLLVTQGNVLYAQGRVEEARFPYLRAALMYPDSGFDGLAYLNAGQCFLDMSARLAGKEQEKSDKLLVNGMRLLATAAGTYKVGDAAKRYRENKARYEEIMAKSGEKEDK